MKYQAVVRSFLGRLLVLVAIVVAMAGAFVMAGSTAHAASQRSCMPTDCWDQGDQCINHVLYHVETCWNGWGGPPIPHRQSLLQSCQS